MNKTRNRKPVTARQLNQAVGVMAVVFTLFVGIALVRGDAWELFITVLLFAMGLMLMSFATAAKLKQNEEATLAMLRQRQRQAERG